ncbi:MAG: sugar kinase [Clostridia bacterium]|nr:sugar kinase [Clostridia bacterium]
MMKKTVTFGEIMLRLAPEGYYRFFQNDRMQATFGGAEANVAVSLANFGDRAAFVTKVPAHAVGQGAVDSLRSFGVDTSFIARGGNRLGIYFLEKGSNQRGSVCIYDRAGSAIAEASPSDFDWNDILDDAGWFHFTGITPALSKNAFLCCLDAVRAAKERGITVSCDLNYRGKLWSKDAAREAMGELCRCVDVCIANEEDAKSVFGIEATGTDVYSGKINKEGYIEVAEKMIEKFGFSAVAFTLRTSISASVNDWTAMLYDGKDAFFAREYHISDIVDRVGGGDSFGAGLIYALKNGYDKQKAIEFAVAASCLKHTIEGDFNRVTLAEVEKLMSGDASGRVRR